MTSCKIHELVNYGEKESIFRVGVAEVCKINAHSPFLVGLLNHDDIGKPLRIEDFSDKTGS